MASRRAAVVAALVFIAMVAAGLFAAPASGLGKVKCDGADPPRGADVAVFTGDVDPIVRHNEVGSPHMHDFFGADGWQEKYGIAANYSDLTS